QFADADRVTLSQHVFQLDSQLSLARDSFRSTPLQFDRAQVFLPPLLIRMSQEQASGGRAIQRPTGADRYRIPYGLCALDNVDISDDALVAIENPEVHRLIATISEIFEVRVQHLGKIPDRHDICR